MILILILINIAARIIPHSPNFAAMGATGLFCGAVLPKRYALLIVLLSALVSDYVLLYFSPFGTPTFDGFINPNKIFYGQVQIAVYGSFFFNSYIGLFIRRTREFTKISVAAMACSLQFFLITNAAVWICGAYDRSIHGLYQSYVAGIPFFKGTLEGDLFYTAIFFGVWYVINNSERLALQQMSYKG